MSQETAIARDGTRLAVHLLGEGRPVLLLHGLFRSTASAATRLVLVTAGAFWLIDVNASIASYLFGGVPAELIAARGVGVAAMALLVATCAATMVGHLRKART